MTITISVFEGPLDWKANVLNQLPTLIAVFTGWLLAQIGERLKDGREKKRELARENRQRIHETKIIASSVAAEIAGLFRRYETTVGDRLTNAERPQDFQFGFTPTRFNFFAVFDSNAAKTGLLKPADARDVISFYVLAKGHFENLITWVSEARHRTSDSAQLILFQMIKQTHTELRILIPDLLARLDSYEGGDPK